MPRVVVTGASGLLGRAVAAAFVQGGWEVVGLAFSRAIPGNPLRTHCDLTNEKDLRALITATKPDVIVHCACLNPEKCEANPERAKLINFKVTESLAKISNDNNAWLLYISTDYVFDGKNPPYGTNSETNPLNVFGQTKRDGECALWKWQSDGGVLRVPLLYGHVEHLNESPVTALLSAVLDKREVSLDDHNVRFPTLVDDVAAVCLGLAERKLEHCGLYGTWHWSGSESFTMYEMAVEIAKLLGVPHDHISPTKVVNPKEPVNSQLSCIALEVMGLGKRTPFRTAVADIIAKWKATHPQDIPQE